MNRGKEAGWGISANATSRVRPPRVEESVSKLRCPVLHVTPPTVKTVGYTIKSPSLPFRTGVVFSLREMASHANSQRTHDDDALSER